MKTCINCKRPLKLSYYRTETRKCYCYECYIRKKTEIENNYRNASEKTIKAYEIESMLKRKKENERFMFTMDEELIRAHEDSKFSLIQRDHLNKEMKELADAKYCENELDERRLFGNVI